MTALAVLLAAMVVGQASDDLPPADPQIPAEPRGPREPVSVAPPSPDEASTGSEDTAAAVPTGFSTRLQVGVSSRSVFDIPIRGGDLGFSAGRQFRWVAVYGDLGVFVGNTAAGLHTVDVLVGASTELRIGTRGRLGFGVGLTYLSISRATGGPRMDGLTVTPSAHAACDLVKLDELDIYLALRGALETYGSSGDQPQAEMQVATLSVGLRFN